MPIRRRGRRRPKRPVFTTRPIISRMIQQLPDIHSTDVLSNTAVIHTGSKSALYLLNGVASGTNLYQRSGNRISPLSIEIWGHITNLSSEVVCDLRFMLFYDRQPSGTDPTIANVLADFTAAGATDTDALCGRNPSYTSRFLTLYDKLYTLAPRSLLAAGPPAVYSAGATNITNKFNVFRSLRGLIQQFQGVTSGIGSISSGAVYLLIFTNTTEAVGSGVAVTYSSRFRFMDT